MREIILKKNIDDIKIKQSFIDKPPRKHKIDRVKRFYDKHNRFDKPVKLNTAGFLVDGYSRYLVAKEYGIRKIDCLVKKDFDDNELVETISGKFYEKDKNVYTWVNLNNIECKIGDTVLVWTENTDGKIRVSPILVTGKKHDKYANAKNYKTVLKKARYSLV